MICELLIFLLNSFCIFNAAMLTFVTPMFSPHIPRVEGDESANFGPEISRNLCVDSGEGGVGRGGYNLQNCHVLQRI